MSDDARLPDVLAGFLEQCRNRNLSANLASLQPLSTAHTVTLDAADWGRTARVAQESGFRWSALWAYQPEADTLQLSACLYASGEYLILRTRVPLSTPVLPSHTPIFPAANRPERHVQDLFGLVFTDHPDHRRWTRHQAWSEGHYPLRQDFPVLPDEPQETPPDSQYPFFQAQGSGVYEIPVGPVHAGIIEPGHFRFQAVGETVLNLEERLGYVHKGIEKIAVGRDPESLARLAGRVSGDSTVAHAWAACQAMEHAAGIQVPPRGLHIRAILAERERIANHLGDIGAICNDVGFAFALMQCSRLREDWQRRNFSLMGHRLLMDNIVPGGVIRDFSSPDQSQLLADHRQLRSELDELLPIFEDLPSLEDRLIETGVLPAQTAHRLGVVGYLGKASGIDLDLRRDRAYAPYDQLSVDSPCLEAGDVAARVQVRALEIRQSLDLLDQLLADLPSGPIQCDWQTPSANAEGIGFIEGWRGEIVSYVRFDEAGRIARFFPRDPSWLNWPALEQLIHGNIVPDFPVCNKSVNGSYSGHDL